MSQHPLNLNPYRWLTLLALLGLLYWARQRTATEPFDGNVTTWMLMGRGMLQGKPLYTDLIDHDPPGMPTAFMIAQGIAGYRPAAVFLLNLTVSGLLLLGVYVAVFSATQSVMAGSLAAFVWVILSGDPAVHANQPSDQLFLNLFGVWALGLLLRIKDGTHPYSKLMLAGLLLALATLFWQPAFVLLFCLSMGYTWLRFSQNHPPLALSKELLILTLPTGLAWGLLLAVYSASGQLLPFYKLVFVFNRFYATYDENLFSHFFKPLIPFSVPTGFWPGNTLFTMAVFGPAVLVFLTALVAKRDSVWKMLLFYGVAIRLMTLMPSHLYPPYFMLWQPFCAFTYGWYWQAALPPHWRWIARGLIIFFIGVLAARQGPYYAQTPQQWSRLKFGEEFIVIQRIGRDIPTLLKENETFFEWGIHTGLYFWSHRDPPTGAFYNLFVMIGPVAKALTGHVIHDLQKNRPELFIAIQFPNARDELYENHPVMQWGIVHYRPFDWDGHHGTFRFYALRGGMLEQRITKKELPCHFTHA